MATSNTLFCNILLLQNGLNSSLLGVSVLELSGLPQLGGLFFSIASCSVQVWVAETSESGEKMTIILQNMPREYAQNMRAARIVSKISSAHVVQVHGVAIIPNLRMGFTGIVPAPLLEYCPYGTVWDLLKGRVWRSTASYNPSRGCIRLQQA